MTTIPVTTVSIPTLNLAVEHLGFGISFETEVLDSRTKVVSGTIASVEQTRVAPESVQAKDSTYIVFTTGDKHLVRSSVVLLVDPGKGPETGAASPSHEVTISREQLKVLTDHFWATYPALKQWVDKLEDERDVAEVRARRAADAKIGAGQEAGRLLREPDLRSTHEDLTIQVDPNRTGEIMYPDKPGLYVPTRNIEALGNTDVYQLSSSKQWRMLNNPSLDEESVKERLTHAYKSLDGVTRLGPVF